MKRYMKNFLFLTVIAILVAPIPVRAADGPFELCGTAKLMLKSTTQIPQVATTYTFSPEKELNTCLWRVSNRDRNLRYWLLKSYALHAASKSFADTQHIDSTLESGVTDIVKKTCNLSRSADPYKHLEERSVALACALKKCSRS
jgi:hypothetical protein